MLRCKAHCLALWPRGALAYLAVKTTERKRGREGGTEEGGKARKAEGRKGRELEREGGKGNWKHS